MKKNPVLLLFAVGMLLGLFFAYGCIIEKSSTNTPKITNISYMIGVGSNPVLGNASAPITIVEFTDYQCPYCKRHAIETFPQIDNNYIKTGKVKYYIRDFPITQIHDNAHNGAVAARCAGEHGKYWEMHKLLFENQNDWESLSKQDLAQKFASYVSSLGASESAFSSCFASGKFDNKISADIADSQIYGISGTPSSIIILPKTISEAKLLEILAKNEEYSSRGLISISRDPNGNYVFFIKGAFPYSLFKEVLDA